LLKKCVSFSQQFGNGEGLAKLENIVSKTLLVVMFPSVAKLTGNKQCFAAPVTQRENIVWENK